MFSLFDKFMDLCMGPFIDHNSPTEHYNKTIGAYLKHGLKYKCPLGVSPTSWTLSHLHVLFGLFIWMVLRILAVWSLPILCFGFVFLEAVVTLLTGIFLWACFQVYPVLTPIFLTLVIFGAFGIWTLRKIYKNLSKYGN